MFIPSRISFFSPPSQQISYCVLLCMFRWGRPVVSPPPAQTVRANETFTFIRGYPSSLYVVFSRRFSSFFANIVFALDLCLLRHDGQSLKLCSIAVLDPLLFRLCNLFMSCSNPTNYGSHDQVAPQRPVPHSGGPGGFRGQAS